MFIPILFLTLTLASADVMTPKGFEHQPPTTDRRPSMPPLSTEKPEVELNPGETVKVKADQTDVINPVELKLEERSPPGKAGSNCIDCAISNLPETAFSVKVPRLGINFEVSDFPSSRLIFATLARKVKSIPFIESLSFPSDIQRMQLRALGDVEVLVSIPKLGWKQVLKLSDVVSGFEFPKIPSIAPKVGSCVGDCLDS
uniref:2b protein n=1 Tax=Tobacco streak virus TaxID=12317 RepID=D2DJ48_9BROM|nr:2b protein [Tobacco streak virus]ACT67449.1 2b protein [Tobacco streak virus]AQX34656.1 2b protein [Tobacco streak virus]WKW78647.1 2b protein [Tobacco streak virus]